jgi:hypothetical protein
VFYAAIRHKAFLYFSVICISFCMWVQNLVSLKMYDKYMFEIISKTDTWGDLIGLLDEIAKFLALTAAYGY